MIPIQSNLTTSYPGGGSEHSFFSILASSSLKSSSSLPFPSFPVRASLPDYASQAPSSTYYWSITAYIPAVPLLSLPSLVFSAES
ncbi:predicted protein [Botrytis cinerea T4]|uniref:Uncharacterized protein n=1 Tax=Botryotinia fuckeliana (strain T4) TaxID=999810 RepID=G2YDS4_BOTF4|nr:predicted protein [Botrytis cinerea T4]